MDGVDAAAIVTDGQAIFEFGPAAYRPYEPAERAAIRAALGRWPGEGGVAEAARLVEGAHAEVMAGLPGEVLGFHGQTLAHEPRGRGTHQAGDGARLAAALGRAVVWDFRGEDVSLGGEGAPLAPAFHFACAKRIGARMPLAFLNLGGVGNLTWIDPRLPASEAPGALMAFDTGPANAPLDDLMTARTGRAMDEGGRLAASGTPDEGVIDAFLTDPYFARMPPKSLDRGAFAGLAERVAALSDKDAAATLAAAIAATVARGLSHCPVPPERILVTGGGRRNAAVMEMLAARTGLPVAPVESEGLDGDMLEAQAFAYLAVRVTRRLPTSFPATTGVRAAVSGGRLSRPG